MNLDSLAKTDDFCLIYRYTEYFMIEWSLNIDHKIRESFHTRILSFIGPTAIHFLGILFASLELNTTEIRGAEPFSTLSFNEKTRITDR